jgi:hypothetical protein
MIDSVERLSLQKSEYQSHFLAECVLRMIPAYLPE